MKRTAFVVLLLFAFVVVWELRLPVIGVLLIWPPPIVENASSI